MECGEDMCPVRNLIASEKDSTEENCRCSKPKKEYEWSETTIEEDPSTF